MALWRIKTAVFLVVVALQSTIQVSAKINTKPKDSTRSEYQVTLTSHNLSEDMHLLSTHDDEIILFIIDSAGSFLYTLQYVFSDSNPQAMDTFSLPDSLLGHFSVWLLEEDFDVDIASLQSKLLLHDTLLRAAFHETRYSEIRRHIGSVDILGITDLPPLNFPQTVLREIKGRHKADKYHYSLNFHRLN